MLNIQGTTTEQMLANVLVPNVCHAGLARRKASCAGVGVLVEASKTQQKQYVNDYHIPTVYIVAPTRPHNGPTASLFPRSGGQPH